MLLFGGREPNWFVESFTLASTRFTPQGEKEEEFAKLKPFVSFSLNDLLSKVMQTNYLLIDQSA